MHFVSALLLSLLFSLPSFSPSYVDLWRGISGVGKLNHTEAGVFVFKCGGSSECEQGIARGACVCVCV